MVNKNRYFLNYKSHYINEAFENVTNFDFFYMLKKRGRRLFKGVRVVE